MLDEKGRDGTQPDAAEHLTPVSDDARPENQPPDGSPEPDDGGVFYESLTDEIAALIDDGQTYAKAEIAFQKTRAALAGRSIGFAVGLAIVAIVLFHIALLALAVGLVIALAPLVTIWGAIAIVVGVLLLATGFLLYRAMSHGKLVSELFSNPSSAGDADDAS